MSAKSRSKKDGTTPKRVKSKNQSLAELGTATKPTTKPIYQATLNFQITSVANLVEYSKKMKIYDFKIEATHQKLDVVTSAAGGTGEIYVCPCPNDDEATQNGGMAKRLSSPLTDPLAMGDNESNTINLNYDCSIKIDPANLNDVNNLVDSPLLLTLYQIQENTPPPPSEIKIDESDVTSVKTVGGKSLKSQRARKKKNSSLIQIAEDEPKPVVTKTALGYAGIDLMGLVNGNPVNESQQVFIYPIRVHAEFKTPIVSVKIKSEEPLCQLGEQWVCNLTFTLENIFNPPEFIFSPTIEVFIDISLITKYVAEGNHESKKLVTFSHGKLVKNKPNDLFKKWNGFADVNCVDLHTKLRVIDSFDGIYNPQNIDLSFFNDDSHAIRFNSISRQLLTREMCTELEHLIRDNEQQIMAEIRFQDNEQYNEELQKEMQFMYVGTMDMAPLLFPEVTSGRFIISIKKLDQPEAAVGPKTEKKERSKKIPQSKMTKSMSLTARETKSLEILPTESTGVLRLKKDPTLEKVDSEIFMKDRKYCVGSLLEMPLIGEEMCLILEISFDKPITKVPAQGLPIEHINYVPIETDIFENDKNFMLATEAIEAEFEEEILKIFKELPYHLEAASYVHSGNSTDFNEKIEKIPFLRDMRANIVNTIMRLVAVKYNYCRIITDHGGFKNLLAVVYNDLTEKIIRAANDYFAGNNNRLDLKERENKDLHIFVAKEFRELEYKTIFDHFFEQRLNDPTDFEEVLIDLAINDLEELQYEKAELKVKELLIRSPKNLYGLIIQAYNGLMQKGITEIYPFLLNIIKECPENVEVWTLLYVLYKRQNYRPGYIHCKMMYEKNCAENLHWLPFFSTRKEPYFEAQFGQCVLYNCIYIFLKLGTYQFAEILYDVLKDRFNEKEKIIILSSIYLLTKQSEVGLENLKNFKATKSNEMIIRLYKGHFLYAMGNKLAAVREYQVTFHSPESKVKSQIASLRCGFYDLKEKKFRTAKTYFAHCVKSMATFLSWYGLGICFFRENQLAEAELSFSKATDMYKSFGEVWVYLAMINIKLDKKNEAIVCFDIARKHLVKDQKLREEMISCFHEKHVPLPALF